ncbi:MAG TPA: channel protein TolC, partial [Burkholderiales bacterium]|nr:channel protein TolC [Burkholderiales bacterium]
MKNWSRNMLAAGLLLAGQAAAADLMSIYREAQVQDATYAGAKAQYIAAQEKLPQAKSLLL